MLSIFSFLMAYRRYVGDMLLVLGTLGFLYFVFYEGEHHQQSLDALAQAEQLKQEQVKAKQIETILQGQGLKAAQDQAVLQSNIQSLQKKVQDYAKAHPPLSACPGPDSDWVRIDSDAVAAANGSTPTSGH